MVKLILIKSMFCNKFLKKRPLIINSKNFKDRDFIIIVPLETSLWIKAIKIAPQNPYQITDEEVNLVYDPFPMQKCKDDFITLT